MRPPGRATRPHEPEGAVFVDDAAGGRKWRSGFSPGRAVPVQDVRYAGNLELTSRARLACFHDTTPPTLSPLVITPACLWPPNSKLVAYEFGSSIQYQVSDDCDPQPTVRIVGIASSENASGAFGFDGDSACLRSERLGNGAGRTYTITLEARDASGNVSQASASVLVPKASSAGCKVSPGAFVKDGDPRCAFQ